MKVRNVPFAIIFSLLKICLAFEDSHPLDPLTETEINQTVSIIKSHRWEKRFAFHYISLKEPPKAQLLQYFLRNTNPLPGAVSRISFAIIYDRATKRTQEVTVNLDTKQVEKWETVAERLGWGNTPDEDLFGERIAKSDPRVVDRIRKLGWTNMSLVGGYSWPMAYVEDIPDYKGKRLVQVYFAGRNFDDDNANTHPFNFVAVVDLDEGRVINIEDTSSHDDQDPHNKEETPVPRATSQYRPTSEGSFTYRKDLNPLNISQPHGPSYRIKGHEIQWQKFKFRVGFNGREGLVIYNVNYKDGNTVRPLFYRMPLAELYVPYGDPRSPYHRKSALDEGDYGLGISMMKLTPQMDCLGEVHMFSWTLHNEQGDLVKYPRAACVSEEDDGVLWKHTDFRSGQNTVVRSQRLTLTFVTTFQNYDYVFGWHFNLDGTIEHSIKLTGLLTTNLLAPNVGPQRHCSIVFPQIVAQYHQHFFTLRLDADIDGNNNTVAMVDVVPLSAPTGSPENPYGQGFTTNVTVFRTTSSSRTNNAPKLSRTWVIGNPNKLNPYTGQPIGWKLQPRSSPPLFMKPDSSMRKRVAYLDFHTWVTPYHDEQFYPAGFYINNSGLPEWVQRDPNANVENTDIVLWHTVGVTHVPSTEDFPSMTAQYVKTVLRPVNFFLKNPALDVPTPVEGKLKDEL